MLSLGRLTLVAVAAGVAAALGVLVPGRPSARDSSPASLRRGGARMTTLITVLLTVLRGLRSRTLLSVTSLAMMVLAVSGAVLGPMFQLAATESYTLTRLDESPDPVTALSWQVSTRGGTDLETLVASATDLVEEAVSLPSTPRRRCTS